LRIAVEISWSFPQHVDYAVVATQLSSREGTAVNQATARQRVSRGVRALERWIRAGAWGARSPRVTLD